MADDAVPLTPPQSHVEVEGEEERRMLHRTACGSGSTVSQQG